MFIRATPNLTKNECIKLYRTFTSFVSNSVKKFIKLLLRIDLHLF